MQECAYRPNALLARIGRTPGTTTTVCSVHGARFSSHAPLSPPRARDRFERSTAITARRLPLQLSSAAPSPASAAAVPRRRRRPRHLFVPNEHLRRSAPHHSPSALERISTTHSSVRTTYGGHFPSHTSHPSAPRASSALYHAVARSFACRTPQKQGAAPATCTTATAAIAHPPRRLLRFTCTTILSCPHAASL
jgi:hypothetical protein